MPYETRDQSGAAFKNRRKDTASHPDFTGDAVVNGQPVWLDLWRKTDRNGEEYFSIAFKNKQPTAPKTQEQETPELDDDVPW